MNQEITIADKKFKPYIPEDKIHAAVKKIASAMNSELRNEKPLFLVVLNGSFMFAADLLKEITIPCEISFIKVASYAGVSSSGDVSELIGLTEDLSGRCVVIVEDIVDSGLTLRKLYNVLGSRKPKCVKVATALFKPASYKMEFTIDYIGFSIPDDFVIGYGMDYNGLGRNLKEIHVLA
jgi:hypoxanthine phosphoribosyltransferase